MNAGAATLGGGHRMDPAQQPGCRHHPGRHRRAASRPARPIPGSARSVRRSEVTTEPSTPPPARCPRCAPASATHCSPISGSAIPGRARTGATPRPSRSLATPVGCPGPACWSVAAAFDRLHGFDDAYFMYFEDVDLGYRLGKAGYLNRYEPAAVVSHSGAHSTTGESAAHDRRPPRQCPPFSEPEVSRAGTCGRCGSRSRSG